MAPSPFRPRGVPISELGLPPKLLERVTKDGVITDTFDLAVLHPDALRQLWGLTTAHVERINLSLEQKGLRPLDLPEGVVARAKITPICEEPGRVADTVCGMKRMKGKRKCGWHWLLSIPIEKQIVIADERAARNRAREGHIERVRVPKEEWPEGGRWCSECQQFVPWLYVLGTKCKAHASRAAHASRLKTVYDLTRDQYEALLFYQGGRCYICRQEPRAKRLAVDHDHRTGEVRGLLCANDEWGCNVTLRRLLNSIDMAQRALAYVTMSPFDRMRSEMPDESPELAVVEEPAAWNPFAVAQ